MRYIGKADKPQVRLARHIIRANSTDHRGAWIRSLLAQGLRPELQILMEIPRDGWQEIEKRFIQVFRAVGMNLVNSTDGGDGGRNPSPETRAKMRLAKIGKTLSSEIRAKMSASQKNQSMKIRERRSAAMLGNKNRLGHKHSPGTRTKISVAGIGNKRRLGKKLSKETRAKREKKRSIIFTTLDDPGLKCPGLVQLWMQSWLKLGWQPRVAAGDFKQGRQVLVSIINYGLRPSDRWRKPTEFGTGKWRSAKLVNFSARWQHPAFDQVTAIRNAYGSRS